MNKELIIGQPMLWANVIMATMDDPHPAKGFFNTALATQQMFGDMLITHEHEGVRVDAVACQVGGEYFHLQHSDKTGHEGVLPRISHHADTLEEAVAGLNKHCKIMNDATGLDDEVISETIRKATINLMFGR